MRGLMMDFQLTIPTILRRAESFFGHKEVVTRLPDRSIVREVDEPFDLEAERTFEQPRKRAGRRRPRERFAGDVAHTRARDAVGKRGEAERLTQRLVEQDADVVTTDPMHDFAEQEAAWALLEKNAALFGRTATAHKWQVAQRDDLPEFDSWETLRAFRSVDEHGYVYAVVVESARGNSAMR